MANIELVIKMPEDVFKRTMFYREFRDLNDCVTTIKALEKAIPLPRGHGRLIDADAYAKKFNTNINGRIDAEYVIAPTIIEADTESEGAE